MRIWYSSDWQVYHIIEITLMIFIISHKHVRNYFIIQFLGGFCLDINCSIFYPGSKILDPSWFLSKEILLYWFFLTICLKKCPFKIYLGRYDISSLLENLHDISFMSPFLKVPRIPVMPDNSDTVYPALYIQNQCSFSITWFLIIPEDSFFLRNCLT